MYDCFVALLDLRYFVEPEAFEVSSSLGLDFSSATEKNTVTCRQVPACFALIYLLGLSVNWGCYYKAIAAGSLVAFQKTLYLKNKQINKKLKNQIKPKQKTKTAPYWFSSLNPLSRNLLLLLIDIDFNICNQLNTSTICQLCSNYALLYIYIYLSIPQSELIWFVTGKSIYNRG